MGINSYLLTLSPFVLVSFWIVPPHSIALITRILSFAYSALRPSCNTSQVQCVLVSSSGEFVLRCSRLGLEFKESVSNERNQQIEKILRF